MSQQEFSYRSDRLQAVVDRFLEAEERGTPLDRERLLSEHPELADSLRAFFEQHDRADQERAENVPTLGPESSPIVDIERTILASEPRMDTRKVKSEGGAAMEVNRAGRSLGDYQLLEEIARGGMGIVYRARQRRLNRIVALKMIQSGELAGEEQVRRFQLEAEAAAHLHHPAIVPIYEVGEVNGTHFYSMHYVDGKSLADVLHDSVLQPLEAARLLLPVCDAMEYAHQQGVIHRDLKPGNILLTASNPTFDSRLHFDSSRSERRSLRSVDANEDSVERQFPLITDFGLAKQVRVDSELTSTGQVIGTPNYMSPEQARGDEVTPATDIYGLGAVLYASITGHPPFRAARFVDVLNHVLEKEPVSPRSLNPEIDRDLETICLKCLQKEPSERYETALDLKRDLERFLNLEPIKARPVSGLIRSWRWCQRNPVVSSLGGLLATIMLVLAIVGPSVAFQQASLRGEADRLVVVQEGLIGELNRSVQETETARNRAEATAEELNKHLVNMFVERGNTELENGDAVAALPWYIEALAMEADAPDRQWGHRIRLNAILRRAQQPNQIWEIDTGPYSATISSDGRWVVVGARDGHVSIWDAQTGDQLYRRKSLRRGAASAVEISADKERLMYAAGRSLELIDIANNRSIISIDSFKSVVRCGDLDRTGEHLAIGLSDGTLLVYSESSGDKPRTFQSHGEGVVRVEIRTDRNRLLSCSHDGEGRLFNLESGELIARLDHDGALTWAEFDDSGSQIVTSSEDGLAKVWSARTGEPIGLPFKHREGVRVARFDASGTRVATGDRDAMAWVWSVSTGALLAGPLEHENSIPSLDFSPDGNHLLTGSVDHTARLWNVTSGMQVAPALHHGYVVRNVAFFPNGNQVMTVSDDGTVRTWEFQPATHLISEVQHAEGAKSCSFSPNSALLLTSSRDGTARLWHTGSGAATGVVIRHDGEVLDAEFNHHGNRFVTASEDGTARICGVDDQFPAEVVLRHDARVWHAEFSHDGRFVLTACDDGVARVWDSENAQLIHSLEHRRAVTWATFSADGSKILTCSDDRTARVWDTESGKTVGEPLDHTDKVEGGNFSGDGTLVVTASLDHTARVWSIESGKVIRQFKHSAGIRTAQFTPDGTRVVTGARDGSGRIWALETGAASPPLSIGRGLVRAVVSPCGRFVATAGGQRARLWDAQTGRLLAAEMQHGNWVNDAEFSRDSTKLVSACEDGYVRVWEVPEVTTRSVKELRNLVHLISGQRADSSDGLQPLSASEIRELLDDSAQ